MSDNSNANAARGRIDFMYVFDVTEGNPNGDPDNAGSPRIDSRTGHGIVTDVCIKRKIRNYVGTTAETLAGGTARNGIFVQQAAVLNRRIDESEEALGPPLTAGEDDAAGKGKGKKGSKDKSPALSKEEKESLRHAWLCERYFDVRAFGQVLSTGDNPLPPLRGPIQFTNFKSTHPIDVRTMSITRCAVTNEADAEKERTMGKKYVVPYAAYVGYGFYSPYAARKTGFDADDFDTLVSALRLMWDTERSAMRGFVSPRLLAIFNHNRPTGDCSAHNCFDTVRLVLQSDRTRPASWSNFNVETEAVPNGVSRNVLWL